MPSRALKRSRLDSESSESEDFSPTSSKLAMSDITKTTYAPKLNLYEHTNAETSLTTITATLGLPGMKPEDVTIELLHGKLTISGESVDHQFREGTRRYIRELPDGKFSRVLTVPLGMSPKDIKARMDHGLLTLTHPKDPPKQEPQRIPIE